MGGALQKRRKPLIQRPGPPAAKMNSISMKYDIAGGRVN